MTLEPTDAEQKLIDAVVPLEEGDDLIDRLIEQHPGFRKLLERRLRERSVSVAVAQRRLAGGAPAKTPRARHR